MHVLFVDNVDSVNIVNITLELHEPLDCANLHNICLLIVLVLLGVLNRKSGFHFPISNGTYN